MEQPKKLRKLTKKQRGFVADYVLDENGTQAVMNNYEVKDNIVAKSIASENLTKPYIVDAIEETRKTLKNALIDKEVDEDKIAETIKELLDATDEKGLKDYTAKDKGLKHALSIYGVEDPEKPKSQNTYNFIFNAEAQSEIKAMEEKIKAKLINPDA